MTHASAASWRIGCVKYLNARPLIHGWPGKVVFDHPAALCALLAAGELEVALVSSFEYLRNPIYSIVDAVAIGCDGPVQSVFVAHRGQVDDIREIALDPASLTSASLLRCLLAERGSAARLIESGSNKIDPGSARLLIGDQAIRFRAEHADEYAFWDLGSEWKRIIGLPFVFALWLIRPEAAGAPEIAQLLRRQRDENLERLEKVIAASASEFSPVFSNYYFRECLRFSFADAEKAGLLRFRSLCQKHGLLPTDTRPLRLV